MSVLPHALASVPWAPRVGSGVVALGWLSTGQTAGSRARISAETEAWGDIYRNFEAAFHMARPLFLHTGLLTEQIFEELYQQMLIEMHAEDFCAVCHLLTVSGTKPAE